MIAYRASGVVVRKKWLVGIECCPACEELDGETVGLDDEFSDGSDAPPKHPNCRCSIRPIVAEAEKVAKNFNPDQPRDENGKFANIGALADSARKNPDRAASHLLGAVSRSNVEAVHKNVGVDLSGYKRKANDQELRHAFNSHGDTKKEKLRGQRAITSADFGKLGSITNKPGTVSLSPKDWRGLPCMEYVKEIHGETYHYVEARNDRAAEVVFVSLRVHVGKQK